MKSLYSSPLRVYLGLGILALAGLWSGAQLPISLFPNSSKPTIVARINYGNSTPEEFFNTHGQSLESRLRGISNEGMEVERTFAYYQPDSARFEVEFKWGAPPRAAFREVETVVNSYAAQLSEESRDSIGIWNKGENAGFLAVSFYSPTRSLDEIYELLDPALGPKVAKVQDAIDPGLWNPARKEVRVELLPEKMATLQLLPKDVERAIRSTLDGYAGGSVTVGTRQLKIQMPRRALTMEEMGQITVSTPSGRAVHLTDLARIDYGVKSTQSRAFKTSGQPSIILLGGSQARRERQADV